MQKVIGSTPICSTTQLITRSFSLQDGHLRGFSRGECIVSREGFFGRFCPPETPKSILVLRFFSAGKGHGNYYHCARTHPCSLFLQIRNGDFTQGVREMHKVEAAALESLEAVAGLEVHDAVFAGEPVDADLAGDVAVGGADGRL